MDFAFSRNRIEEDQIFLKSERLRRDFSLRRQGHARAVKNQAIVAAHLVDVNDGPVMVSSNGLKHFQPKSPLVDGVGRSRNIQKHGNSLPDEFSYGIAVIPALGPEVFVVPDVLANRNAQLLFSESVRELLA